MSRKFLVSSLALFLLTGAGPCASLRVEPPRCSSWSISQTNFELHAIIGTSASLPVSARVMPDSCAGNLREADCSGPDSKYWAFDIPHEVQGGVNAGTVTFHPPPDTKTDQQSTFCFGVSDYSKPMPCEGGCVCSAGGVCESTNTKATVVLNGHIHGHTVLTLTPAAQTFPFTPMFAFPTTSPLTIGVSAVDGPPEPMTDIEVDISPAAYAKRDAVPSELAPGTFTFSVTPQPRWVRPGWYYPAVFTVTVSGRRKYTGGPRLSATATINVI